MTLTPEELDRLSKMTDFEISKSEYGHVKASFVKGMLIQRQLSEWRKTQKEASEPNFIVSDRDWQEDFAHENGKYINQCGQCLQPFVGHKRRVRCKLCSVPNEQTPEKRKEYFKRFADTMDKAFPDGIPEEDRPPLVYTGEGIHGTNENYEVITKGMEEQTPKQEDICKKDCGHPCEDYPNCGVSAESPRKEEEWTVTDMGYNNYYISENGRPCLFPNLAVDPPYPSLDGMKSICARLNAHQEVSLPSDEEIEEKVFNDYPDIRTSSVSISSHKKRDIFREACKWLRSRIKQP